MKRYKEGSYKKEINGNVKPVRPVPPPLRASGPGLIPPGKWGCYLSVVKDDVIELVKMVGVTMAGLAGVALWFLMWAALSDLFYNRGYKDEAFFTLVFGILVVPFCIIILWAWIDSIKERCK